MSSSHLIRLRGVSRFYGEVLGVNRVDLELQGGVTALVGPNGSGKTTLMHLVAGLLRPSRGDISVLGCPVDDPERLYRLLGFCTQFDTFPAGITGFELVSRGLRLRGLSRAEAEPQAWEAIERVGMVEAARRRVAGYSKGMRQRIKLANALAHDPPVLLLDEPLNGLDPMAREETLDLFRRLGGEGRHVVISSHILHEVDAIAERVVFINAGAVLAEGAIRAVRQEITAHPQQVLVRCDRPRAVAAAALALDHVVQVRMLEEDGVLLHTRDGERFWGDLPRLVLEAGVEVEGVQPVDADVDAVYEYLIGPGGGTT